MAPSPSSPSFAKPPLEEVALAIQFQPLALDLLSAAEFSQRMVADFPRHEEQPARPPMREEFPVGPQPQFRFEILSAPAVPRLWLLSESGTRLLQLQSDLIAYNWRLSPAGVPAVGEEYPRYRTLRDELEAHLVTLEGVTKRLEGPLIPNWCEVTYINQIGPMEGSSERPALDDVLRGIEVTSGGYLPAPEDASATVRFVIPGDEQPRGRLNVALTAAVRTTDAVPIWVLTLTARLLHTEEETLTAALKTLDVGHDWVVNGFAELTSDRMHAVWERVA